MISDGSIGRFPFQISLNEFRLECYPGTFAPMDYVSKITIIENGKDFEGVISMNNIFKYMMMSEMMKGGMAGTGNGNMSAMLPFMMMSGGNMGDMFDGMFDFDMDLEEEDTEPESEEE